MKKVLLVAVVLFITSFADAQVSAQTLKGLNNAVIVEGNR